MSNSDNAAPVIRAHIGGHYREDGRYPVVVVNVTNHCNLACQHCFIFRDGNPNQAPRSIRHEMAPEWMLETLCGLRERHGITAALWMGGEPLLKPDLLEKGIKLFRHNTITTNGTIALRDFGPEVLYVVSLDGPEDLNDAIRGDGSYRRVMRNLLRIPLGFSTPVQVQCVITRRNQHRLEELVEAVQETQANWMTFSFYVPRASDTSPDAWETVEERVWAVREVQRLKAKYEGFVRNSTLTLELMLPPSARRVTDACPAHELILPLYLQDDHFTTPFCCYGNDVDCDRCGAWVVFYLASRFGGERWGIADSAAAP